MFGVGDMFDFWIPTASTAAALVALLRGRAASSMINNRGPMGPGVAGLTVVFAVA